MLWTLSSCDNEIINIANPSNTTDPANGTEWTPSPVIPIDVNEEGFDLLENMQGHWVGTNRVIADDFDWFAFAVKTKNL